jgi:long-chain fatty acid transport protein
MLARPRSSKWTVFLLAVLSPTMAVNAARAQLGTILSGTGPINRSMGGAATAAPLSASGAMYWNPATITGLGRSELEASAELLFPSTQVDSRMMAGALGPGIPPIGLAGHTDSDAGAYPLPTIGLAYLPEGSPWSFGLGVFALAGFGVDYAGSTTNFPLTAPPPAGVGFGPVFSEFQVLQIHPAVAYQLTDRLSVAAGPTLNLAIAKVAPALFTTPDDANGDGFRTYPAATHSEATWGAGFAVGAYYKADTWAVGASFKSPQWFDTFRFDSADELGRPRRLEVNLDLPLIASVGAAYTGLERWVFAVDGRFLDYRGANFFGDSGISPEGAVRGLGWRSIFAVAAGAQFQLTDAVSLRAGYSWNQNPIPDSQSFINAVSPVIVEHTVFVGASWNVTEDFSLSFAYGHGFENSIEGPLLTPAGAVPGTSVKNSAAAEFVVFGASLSFGGPRRSGAVATNCQPVAGSDNQSPRVAE